MPKEVNYIKFKDILNITYPKYEIKVGILINSKCKQSILKCYDCILNDYIYDVYADSVNNFLTNKHYKELLDYSVVTIAKDIADDGPVILIKNNKWELYKEKEK